MGKQKIMSEIENEYERDTDAIEEEKANNEASWMEQYYYYEQIEQQEYLDVNPEFF